MEPEPNLKSQEAEAMVDFLTSGPQLRPSAASHQAWLDVVRARGHREQRLVNATQHRWKWAAVAGWAVACVGIGAAIWPRASQEVLVEVVKPTSPQVQARVPVPKVKGESVAPVVKTQLTQELDKLKAELAEMRAKAKSAPRPTPRERESRFTVFELAKNGKGKATSKPSSFSSKRLAGYLTEGIERELDRARLAQQGSAGELVVGPPYGNWDATAASRVLVFPGFPAAQWQSLGLMQGQGVLYDPSRGLLWQPQNDVAGTWKGLPVERSSWLVNSLKDATAPAPAPVEASTVASVEPEVPVEPSMLVTMNEETGEGTLLVDNLPPLPPGEEYVVAVNDASTNQSVAIGTFADINPAGSMLVSFSTAGTALSTDGISIFKIDNNLRTLSVDASNLVVSIPPDAYSAGFVTTTAEPTNPTSTTP
jgi:hypothetical protein